MKCKGTPTQAQQEVKKDLGKKWHLSKDLQDEQELVQMNREKRKQEVPGSEENTWYIQIFERSVASSKEKEKRCGVKKLNLCSVQH